MSDNWYENPSKRILLDNGAYMIKSSLGDEGATPSFHFNGILKDRSGAKTLVGN